MINEVNKQVVAYNISDEESNISLTKVIYRGHIVGKFNIWTVEQEYLNLNTDHSVEIYYTFPLKAGATVTSFTATIGDKVIKGVVSEKQQTNHEYQQAIAKGNSAYMMERLDSNMFKMSLGRVMPDELVNISISYIETCDVYDNQIDILVPTLVGQRYNDYFSNELKRTDEVEYTCDFIVHIEDNLSVQDVNSSSHTIKVVDNKQVISLNNRLNRDFKLAITLKDEFKTCALINGHYLLVDLMPRLNEPKQSIQKKYVFVIDRSGSMKGRNIHAVKDLLKAVLTQLEKDDLIEIISFGTRFEALFHSLRTVGSVRSDLNHYINALSANMGGTEILLALEKSLTYSADATIIVITDSQVGNENHIYNKVASKIRNNRLFMFGLDMNVNESFLDNISKAGHGKAYYFSPSEGNYTQKLIRAFSNINGAISSNVNISTKNKEFDRFVYSDTVFNNEYWTAILKLESFDEEIVVAIDDKPIVIKKEEIKSTDLELNKVFATCKINYYESLINRDSYNTRGYQDLIVHMAIENQIDSNYTAFLAINERDNKVYDVPQIEETIVERSLNYCRMEVRQEYNAFSYEELDEPLRNELPASTFADVTIESYEDIDLILKYCLNELLELISSMYIATLHDLILDMNILIKGLDSKITISDEVKVLIEKIKATDESVYNQLFNGVNSIIKKLFE